MSIDAEAIDPVDPSPTLRLLTYNVRSLREDPAAVARVIRSAKPHVVCIQEAPRLLRWRSKCAALARRSGLVVVSGGGTAAGNLILSTLGVEVLEQHDVLLSREPGMHRRGIAMASLRWRGFTFAVAGTHLDLKPAARLRHVDELERAIESLLGTDIATVLAGDVNDVPGSPSWQAMADRRTDAFAAVGSGDGFTFTAANPTRRIDGIFAGLGLDVVSATVLDGPDVHIASDHRPLLVEVRFSAH
jgi:endonuclease/exonuclease/phosphatase family metal-dependent hydrolase